jgi:translation initiation factor IF-2
LINFIASDTLNKIESGDTSQEVIEEDTTIPDICFIPEKINFYELSNVIKVDLDELMEEAYKVAEELGVKIIDEFQPIRKEMIDNLCMEFDRDYEIVQNKQVELFRRPPIVTIMGHVDHGKTTLLDAFRGSNLVDKEFGAITQTTAAFSFKTKSGHFVTFIDTPGHEVFDGMRIRGAKATDMVVVVISAVESIQKQTIEVLNLIKKYGLPMIVAINKIDRDFADPDKVLLDIAEFGIDIDELGGKVPTAKISALKKEGLECLEEKIIKLATELDLKAPHNVDAECLVVESIIDETTNQVVASIVVRKGVLSIGDAFICGLTDGKVKFILNDKGK